MRAVLVMMEYDYGEKTRGYSYEYINIFLPLRKILGEENLLLFDFYSEFKKSGKASMNLKLKEFITSERPDFTLFCLFTNEFDETILETLKDTTLTVAYFFDDPWRIEFAEYWRKYFHFSTTPDYYTHLGYLRSGITNILHVPFGFNSDIYKNKDLEKIYDVSFVGGYSPFRKWILSHLEKQGVKTEVFGRGWGTSWVSQDEMVRIFNQSRINLNLSNSISYDYRFLISALRSPKDLRQLMTLKKNKEQIKGRHYEINGSGGFQLSYFIPGLNLTYEIDKEIAVYESIDSLPSEINFFLKNEDIRNQIAEAGYRKSVIEHTAEGYLNSLIQQILLKRA